MINLGGIKFLGLYVSLSLTLLAGCNNNQKSDAKLVNGSPVDEASSPEVVKILAKFHLEEQSASGCTATWVSHNTILTAAHCVVKDGRIRNVVTVGSGQGQGARALKVMPHPTYAAIRGDLTPMGTRDFAVLIFPNNTASKYVSVYPRLPERGQRIEIYGYGNFNHLDPRSGGTKRYGTNVLTGFEPNYGVLEFEGYISPNQTQSGSEVLNSLGDSGGPMLVDRQIVGVSSVVGAGLSADGSLLPRQRGCYVAVLDPVVLQFLQFTFQHGALVAGINLIQI